MNCKIAIPSNLLRSVACACSKSADRYILQNVQVNFRKNKIILAATDGRCLLAAVVEKVEHDVAGQSFLIPSDLLKALKVSGESVVAEVDGDTVSLREDARYAIKVSREVDTESFVKFPKWRQVVPKGELVPHSCPISRGVADTLFSAMAIFKRKNECNIVGYCFDHEPTGPHICHISDNMFALYMPVRRDEDQKMSVPAWLLSE